MLSRGSTFRLVVSLLLAVTVQFCCCSFHAWLSACARCGDHAQRGSVDAGAQPHSGACTDDHDGDCPSDFASKGHSSHSDTGGPCGPHHGDHGGCSCGNHDSKALTGSAPSVEPPVPVLLAVLDWALTTDRMLASRIAIQRHDVWATARPPTSLLRLHCALVV
jgi:hypothetical protein